MGFIQWTQWRSHLKDQHARRDEQSKAKEQGSSAGLAVAVTAAKGVRPQGQVITWGRLLTHHSIWSLDYKQNVFQWSCGENKSLYQPKHLDWPPFLFWLCSRVLTRQHCIQPYMAILCRKNCSTQYSQKEFEAIHSHSITSFPVSRNSPKL